MHNVSLLLFCYYSSIHLSFRFVLGYHVELERNETYRLQTSNYPYYYQTDSDESWVIKVPQSCDILVEIVRFDTQLNQDGLHIGKGSNMSANEVRSHQTHFNRMGVGKSHFRTCFKTIISDVIFLLTICQHNLFKVGIFHKSHAHSTLYTFH